MRLTRGGSNRRAVSGSVVLVAFWLSVPEANQTPQQKPATVVIFDVAGNGIALSSVKDGVVFAVEGSGAAYRTAWTAPGSDDSFLALDSNGNGVVDSARELVGNRLTVEGSGPASLGVNALQFPLQGYPLGPDGKPIGGVPNPLPKGFGFIEQEDAVFAKLRLWNDANHDGKTGPGELKTLAECNIARIDLSFRIFGSETAPKDDFGNRRFILGKFQVQKQGMLFPHELVEVALAK